MGVPVYFVKAEDESGFLRALVEHGFLLEPWRAEDRAAFQEACSGTASAREGATGSGGQADPGEYVMICKKGSSFLALSVTSHGDTRRMLHLELSGERQEADRLQQDFLQILREAGGVIPGGGRT